MAATPGQDYSYDASGGVAVGSELTSGGDAELPVSSGLGTVDAPADATAAVTGIADGASATGTEVPAGWTVTDTSTPASAEAPVTEFVEAEVVESSAVTDEHRSLFAGVVARSKARSEAGERIAALDAAVADAVVSGAESQGFTTEDRTAGDTNHDLRFAGGAGESLTITLGRIKGTDLAAVAESEVPLTVRFQAATYVGELDAGTGEHGEVIIVSDEWSGQATSTVGLLLLLADYVTGDLDLDTVSLLRDVGATVSIVSDRLR